MDKFQQKLKQKTEADLRKQLAAKEKALKEAQKKIEELEEEEPDMDDSEEETEEDESDDESDDEDSSDDDEDPGLYQAVQVVFMGVVDDNKQHPIMVRTVVLPRTLFDDKDLKAYHRKVGYKKGGYTVQRVADRQYATDKKIASIVTKNIHKAYHPRDESLWEITHVVYLPLKQ